MGTWRIHPTPAETALARWQDGLAGAFVRLDAHMDGAGPFSGRIDGTRVGTLTVSRVRAAGHEVRRRAEHIRHDGADIVFANLQIAGRCEVETPRGRDVLRPMDLHLVETAEPYAIRHARAFDLLSIALPRAALPPGLAPGAVPLSRGAAGREIAGLIAGLGRLAALGGGAAADALEAQIRATLALGASMMPVGPAGDGDVALRVAIEAQIDRRAGDPDLGAAALAAAFGLSRRRLHALFAGTGRTVGTRIEAARLARAERLLRDASVPIGTVARRAGYRDPAYLARRFTWAPGVTPRDWRVARSSGSPAPSS
ncbi:MAG: helix-turn-helix domain-containing protein [Pseudomonadota bacterium]